MTSGQSLQFYWPRTHEACCQTFFKRDSFGQRLANGWNDAGFLLVAMTRFRENWNATHGHRQIPSDILDTAAANEVWYQWLRKRTWNRPAAALAKCIQTITTERPDKVFRCAEARREHHENAR